MIAVSKEYAVETMYQTLIKRFRVLGTVDARCVLELCKLYHATNNVKERKIIRKIMLGHLFPNSDDTKESSMKD